MSSLASFVQSVFQPHLFAFLPIDASIAAVIIFLILFFGFTAFTGAPFVPSKKRDLEKLFKKGYPLSKKDTLIDLGAGSGTVMRIARDCGAKAIGIELNPFFAGVINWRFRHDSQATAKCCNFYNYKFPKNTTVVYTFADSRDIQKIYDKVLAESARLKKSLTFISYAFPLPDLTPTKKSGAFYVYKITTS